MVGASGMDNDALNAVMAGNISKLNSEYRPIHR